MDKQDRPHLSPWTLGQIRAHNLQVEAYCQTPGCNWFCSFDLDRLIEQAGPDYELPDEGPGIACETCGGTGLKFMLAYPHPAPDDTGK